MNLNISERKNGTYIYIEKSYRDENGNPRKKNIMKLGYVNDLKKDYEDPILHFREVARKMTEEEKEKNKIDMIINMDEKLPGGSVGAKNMGYSIPLKIYHELGIDAFLKGKAQSEKFDFNTNSIMFLLVISRIFSPGSKKKAFDERERYFERFHFTIDDIYRALTHFAKISDELQKYLHESVRLKYGSDTSIIYYDVTNYYFEIKKQDDLRRFGLEKQKRKKPIVQLGLAMDKDGVPLHYELFPGNRLDKETFRSVIGDVRKNYGTGRIVAVADMGVITGDNIYYLVGSIPEKPKNGYIFSFSVRGGSKEFQEYVLKEDGYAGANGAVADERTEFKIKDRFIARDIYVTMTDGRKQKKKAYEKQIVFWSKKYFTKAQAERAEMISKAEALISDPKKFNKATSYGAAAYVNNLEYDKQTGEVLDTGKLLMLNEKKIAEDEKYDGYYSIVTSEINMPVQDILDTYRGLWEIEETFKITKSEIKSRPVYVSGYAHINAHFLTCFIALVIIRVIHKKTNKKYSVEKIIDCLNKIECIYEHENIYLFGYRSEISDVLGELFDIDFTKKRMFLLDIKKILGDLKK
jgi:transposase